MNISTRFTILLIVGILCLNFPGTGLAADQEPTAKNDSVGPWSGMLYAGFGTVSDLGEVLTFNSESEDTHFIGGVLNRQMANFWRHFVFELEFQTIRHFGLQDNWEFNGLFLVRFETFPWDDYLDTSFAVGEGMSIASETPALEEKLHPGDATKLLNYLMFEFAFSLPEVPEWSLVTRIHHRSGIFGTFNSINGGSNFLALGIRRYF